MREIPPALAEHLGEGVTTLCRAWRLRRRDGTIFGFTDHDRDLVFEDTTFAARSGLEAAEASAELGFAIGGGEVAGALSSTGLTEFDIRSGRYDDASVEAWIVNWADPQARLLTDVFSVGEIRREEGAFVAELRGPMHRLDEERGLTYRATCSADLGDTRCRVDLSEPIYTAEASVETTDGALSLATDALAGYAAGWFTAGRLTWLSGANAGDAVEVSAHRLLGGQAELDLWRSMPAPVAPGDAFRVSAGCDKRLRTCRAKFGNVLNHRGYPHMPGNDFVLKVASSGTGVFDGGSLFR